MSCSHLVVSAKNKGPVLAYGSAVLSLCPPHVCMHPLQVASLCRQWHAREDICLWSIAAAGTAHSAAHDVLDGGGARQQACHAGRAEQGQWRRHA